MATWLDLLDDARSIRAIYGDEVPALGWVVLHEVSMHRDGPRVVLRFDLSDYPAHPPKKWLAQECNVVQVQLMLVGVQDLFLRGLSRESRVDLTLASDGQMIKATTSSGSTMLDIRAHAALITGISAYRADTENP